MSFKPTPLFGGAITVDLPSTYGDTSQIRQVPDHQEVYLDTNGYSGVIFEILEYVDKPDEEALQYHFADLVDGTGDATNLLNQGKGVMENTHPVHTLTFIQTPPPPTPSSAHRKAPDYIAIHLLLLRLKDHGTDILITINAPHYPGEYEKPPSQEGDGGETTTKLMKDADELRERVLASFDVREWGLFQG
ncbi:Mog1p/PsbP-like protein [Periconia macrospinosa]|uniref:Mog1p/PsbP-like protein n=1 Tax=Periconia macrospinosa TaxID=97972 RepID=A0A2V1EDI0_9PLEO|nr:Mog1p/PsbP-like protein [Periconia macrospinosa]